LLASDGFKYIALINAIAASVNTHSSTPSGADTNAFSNAASAIVVITPINPFIQSSSLYEENGTTSFSHVPASNSMS
jgi:hypothetical protein